MADASLQSLRFVDQLITQSLGLLLSRCELLLQRLDSSRSLFEAYLLGCLRRGHLLALGLPVVLGLTQLLPLLALLASGQLTVAIEPQPALVQLVALPIEALLLAN